MSDNETPLTKQNDLSEDENSVKDENVQEEQVKDKPKRGRPKKEREPKQRKPYEYTEARKMAYERMKTARDEKRMIAQKEKEDIQVEKALKNLIVKNDKNTIKKVKKVIKRHELSDSDSDDSEAERRIMRKLNLQKGRKKYYSSDDEEEIKPAKKQTGRPHIQPKVLQTQPSEKFEGLMFV